MDLARGARQVRCSGTEKREAWEGCQGSGILKAVVKTVIAAAAAQMDRAGSQTVCPHQAEGDLQAAKHKRSVSGQDLWS